MGVRTAVRQTLLAARTWRVSHLRAVNLRDCRSLRAAVDLVAAAARRTRPGEWIRGGRWDKNLWYSEEARTVEEALRAYSAGPAYASGEEGTKGVLAPGRVADFVVLSRDPRAVTPDELLRIEVGMTVVGGVVRYDASSGSSPSNDSWSPGGSSVES